MIHRLRQIYPIILPAITVLFCLSCNSRQPAPPDGHIPPQSPGQLQIQTILDDTHLSRQRKTVVIRSIEAIGTPYRWGGASPEQGFDCSGLVFFTHQATGISLPRSAAHLYRSGREIPKEDLAPGDLVFFKGGSGKKAMHVGIYIGNHQFIHAPGSGRRVSIASLTNRYFRNHYIGSRSYLDGGF